MVDRRFDGSHKKPESHHNMGESRRHVAQVVLCVEGVLMRAKTMRGAIYFAVLFAVGMIGLGVLGIGASTRAWAQFSSALKEGGTDTVLGTRKNHCMVGVAGWLLSGTNMAFADELAHGFDDGDGLRVIPIVTCGAASNPDDLFHLGNHHAWLGQFVEPDIEP
jgi:hypothetical protein